MSDCTQDVERWLSELSAAGWTRYRKRATVWQAPSGALYLGPFGAWKVVGT